MAAKYTVALSSLAAIAVAIPYQAFPRQGTVGPTCSSSDSSQLSCHNTTRVSNLCCFNAPGGQLLQTQFWDYSPSVGPSNSWTLHGLWPDNCDGTYQQFCDPSRESTDITGTLQKFGKTSLLNYMNTYWLPDSGTAESFWEHEWNKHGTCISTFDPSCYTSYTSGEEVADFFDKTVSLFQGLNTYSILSAAGITPSSSKTYTLSAIQAAIKAAHGQQATVNCVNGALNEVWYHFNVYGSAQSGKYVAAVPIGSASTCPSSGIKYPPKSGSPAPTTTGGGGSTPTSTSGGSSPTGGSGSGPSGKGYLNVSAGGCLISAGKWYEEGTCATFSATASGSGFTLTSSKGNCGVSGGVFTCGSGVSLTTFSSSGSTILYGNSSKFYASEDASSGNQETVYTSSKSVSFTISWQSV